MRARACVLAILASTAIALPVQATVQRTFVASFGNDANTATNCGFTNPCRGFTAAHSVTSSGGEIIALDAAGYGAIAITKSITITANQGFYAGISASSGNAVTIATAAVNVTLRGLNINGIGGANGISMTNGSRLSIENCVISNFSGAGLVVNANAVIRVLDSIFRDNGDGILLDGGVTASVSGSKFLGNGDRGIFLSVEGTTTNNLSVADSQIAGSFVAVQSTADVSGASANVAVIRSSMTNCAYGPAVFAAAGGAAVISVSSSLVSGNNTSIYQSGASAIFESLGNNTMRQNGPPDGTITTVPQS